MRDWFYAIGAAVAAILGWAVRGQIAKKEQARERAKLQGLAAAVGPKKAEQKAEKVHEEVVTSILEPATTSDDDARRVLDLFGGSDSNSSAQGVADTASDK